MAEFASGMPQRSEAGCPVPSQAFARTMRKLVPPDPAGSVMYLVCNRRRQIWRLKPNGTSFQVEASRGPLWPDTPTIKSSMGDIDGDSTGAWYFESKGSQTQTGIPSSVTFPGLGVQFSNLSPRLHRLDASLNLVASYVIAWKISNLDASQGTTQQGFFLPHGVANSVGGSSSNTLAAFRKVDFQTAQPGTQESQVLQLPGGLCAINLPAALSKCSSFHNAGSTIAGLMEVKNPAIDGSTPFPSIVITPTDKAIQTIPLTGYGSMLDENGPLIASCGGAPGTIYACKLGGTDYTAKWDGTTGNLLAYKTPADATPQDQFRAQCIGGSSSVCYTTENNNEIVLRDGGLNLTARFRRADIELFLGATNPANGISNFTFTGIGGR